MRPLKNGASKGAVTALILAAGKGTRMKSEKAKVLHEVCGKPMIGHVIDACIKAGVKDIVIISGPDAVDLRLYTEKSYAGLGIRFAVQKEQLGTAHAVGAVIKSKILLKSGVMILSGDVPLITGDTVALLTKMFTKKSQGGIIGVSFAAEPHGYGRIIVDSDGFVKRIVEEKDANPQEKQVKVVNGGVYIIERESLKRNLKKIRINPAKGEYYLTDIAGLMYNEGRPLRTVDLSFDELAGVNTRKQLAQASAVRNKKVLEKMAESGITIVDFNSIFIEDCVEIGTDTVIQPFTIIKRNTRIGKKCNIGPSAHIRSGSVIGDNCRIGNYVEIKNSVIGNNTNVSHLSYIGDAQLGSRVNIGAGTITANYDGVSKHKTVIGDGAYIGSNVVFVAPVNVGKNTVIAAGSVITEDVQDNEMGIARQRQVNKAGWVVNKRSIRK
jgi:bifunctional UDP-N-acetylglucosamine pyrophosphorylase/glucosamine-1-phosphate N-acetyltransferase